MNKAPNCNMPRFRIFSHLLGLSILVIALTACTFSKNKSSQLFAISAQKAPYDVIIIPGVPHNGLEWSPIMNIRVSWGHYLYQNGLTNNIIFSGNAVYSKYNEARIMAEYGKALGIPVDNIYLDTNAEHSTENITYSLQVAKKNGFKTIGLATDPFQAKSLKRMIKKFELPIDLIPIIIDTLKTIERPEPKIDVRVCVQDSFISIKDRESFFTRLKGTIGSQIIWHEEDLPNEKMIKKFKRKGRLIPKSSQK